MVSLTLILFAAFLPTTITAACPCPKFKMPMNPRDLICGEYNSRTRKVEYCKIRPMTPADANLQMPADARNAGCCDGCNCQTPEPTTASPTEPMPEWCTYGCSAHCVGSECDPDPHMWYDEEKCYCKDSTRIYEPVPVPGWCFRGCRGKCGSTGECGYNNPRWNKDQVCSCFDGSDVAAPPPVPDWCTTGCDGECGSIGMEWECGVHEPRWEAAQICYCKSGKEVAAPKVCKKWEGPGKQVFGLGKVCSAKEVRSADNLMKCSQSCLEDSTCEVIMGTDWGTQYSCHMIVECKTPPSEWIFSDDSQEKGIYYTCADEGKEPWLATKEPTDVSEFKTKSCAMVSGMGTTMEKSYQCDWIAIQNLGIKESDDHCLERCKGIDRCNYVAVAKDPEDDSPDPAMQCAMLTCDHKPVFKAEPTSVAVWYNCEEAEATQEPTLGTEEPTDATPEPTDATPEPTDETPEPTDATPEPSEKPTCAEVVPAPAEVTCDTVAEAISSGKCMCPTSEPETTTTEALVTMTPTTAAPTKEMLWRVEGPDRCPLAYKLGIWGHFGKSKNTKKCEKKCKSRPDCVAISYKVENRACTGFSSCPFFENTAEFGGNEGWINVRVKPEPSAAAASASFYQVEEQWTALRAAERALAVTGVVLIAAIGWNKLRSSKRHSIYLQVEENDL